MDKELRTIEGNVTGLREKIFSGGGGGHDVSDSWLVLQALPGMTPERLQKLIDRFGDPISALAASRGDFTRIAGRKAYEALHQDTPRDIAKRLRIEAERGGAWIITRNNEAYPKPLASIYAAPGVLYGYGTIQNIQNIDSVGIAVVGTRTPTSYGCKVARKLAGALAERGMTIISGLARGIDAEAHYAALEAGGRTIGVLGCGLGVDYPSGHQDLRRQIAENGAVLTELGWNTLPRPENFPRRNRLISGLSIGTIVIEAAQRSGALLTARLALEQGRELFAVPGPIDSGRSAGCHRLLKEGAYLVETVQDVVDNLPPFVQEKFQRQRVEPSLQNQFSPQKPGNSPRNSQPELFSLTSEEAAIYKLLEKGPSTAEDLTRQAGFPPEQVSGILLRLELQGLVAQSRGGLYERA